MISLHEIDFSNWNFWVGFMATSFPAALEETDCLYRRTLHSSNSIQRVIKLYKRQKNISFIIAFSDY